MTFLKLGLWNVRSCASEAKFLDLHRHRVGNAAATVCRRHKKAEGREKGWYENARATLQSGLRKKERLRIQWLMTQKAEDFEAYRRQRNDMVREIRSAKQKYLDDKIAKFPSHIPVNEPKQAFATLKNVMRSTSRKWVDTAAPRPSIISKRLKGALLCSV
ncbi:unnamed protein product [Hymenolepis diminuta]|uniref:Uncharacterized protein n=1 Tax=Hymenolepis diminuta TaxID=6216 RepID=A0A564Y3H7_HYMDI|nr:unnamed protein product [Hymenolepis diminuta]